jgi:hypothetical protein
MQINLVTCFIRPCVRQNFPNFSFSRVWEMFGCQSSEIFRKKTEFLNSQNFCEKVCKKSSELFVFATFGNFSEKNGIFKFAKIFARKFVKKFGYYSKMYVNFENFEKTMHSLSFLVKKPCFWVKKFGKSSGKFEKFGNRVF